jgi:hypothetical protein
MLWQQKNVFIFEFDLKFLILNFTQIYFQNFIPKNYQSALTQPQIPEIALPPNSEISNFYSTDDDVPKIYNTEHQNPSYEP